jgi:hypothetical protein
MSAIVQASDAVIMKREGRIIDLERTRLQWREPQRLTLPLRPLRLTPQDQDFRRVVTQFVDALKSHDPTETTPYARRTERSNSECR